MRITHGTNVLAFVALVVSGYAIMQAHPWLYWGESGSLGVSALWALPLTKNIHHSAWGRNLHFLGAWASVLSGLIYVAAGLLLGHFWRAMGPERAKPMAASPSPAAGPAERNAGPKYNLRQKVAYLVVIFLLFPLVILTGLALSPALVTAFPLLGTVFGGHQSARTIHFFVAAALVLFVCVHVLMVCRAGFRREMRGILLGPIEPAASDE